MSIRRVGRWAIRCFGIGTAFLLVVGFAWPHSIEIPVEGATEQDWNHQTFWYAPWGASGVHRGIDIFAPEGRAVVSATAGIVVFSGELGRGGRVAAVLGPKWRVHYYAHLSQVDVSAGDWLSQGEPIGLVGRTGNAANRPPHLHYSIVTPFPYFWLDLSGPYGWQKMFFLNPHEMLSH